jgi:hypothetical protein
MKNNVVDSVLKLFTKTRHSVLFFLLRILEVLGSILGPGDWIS